MVLHHAKLSIHSVLPKCPLHKPHSDIYNNPVGGQSPEDEDSRFTKHDFIYINQCIGLYTLWSYQLLQKGRRFSAAKLHYIDFNGPLMPLSCIDIRYWVSYNPEICRKSWKMTSRKKIRFLGLAQIVPLFDGLIF